MCSTELEELGLRKNLMTRFDLIWLMLDKRHRDNDHRRLGGWRSLDHPRRSRGNLLAGRTLSTLARNNSSTLASHDVQYR